MELLLVNIVVMILSKTGTAEKSTQEVLQAKNKLFCIFFQHLSKICASHHVDELDK